MLFIYFNLYLILFPFSGGKILCNLVFHTNLSRLISALSFVSFVIETMRFHWNMNYTVFNQDITGNIVSKIQNSTGNQQT